LIESSYSDNQGFYEFIDIPFGDYYLIVDKNTLPSGLGLDPLWFEFFGCAPIVNGNSYLQDFALLTYASVSGAIWQEQIFNGTFDNNENGVNNVNVHIYNEQHQIISSTATDQNGQYTIYDIYPGNYYLSMETPAGLAIIPQPTITNYFHQTNGENTTPWFGFTQGMNMTDLGAALGFGTVALEEIKINAQAFNDYNLVEWNANLYNDESSVELQKQIEEEWESIFNGVQNLTGSYKDYNLDNEVNYYRVKVIDQSGKQHFSNVIAVENKVQSIDIYFQNPIHENLYISFNNQEFSSFKLNIFNSTTCLIHKQFTTESLDANAQLSIDMSMYPAGIYYLDYEIDSKRFTQKFVKAN